MQKAANDVIDIFTSEDMENVTGYFLVKHLHLFFIIFYILIYFVIYPSIF